MIIHMDFENVLSAFFFFVRVVEDVGVKKSKSQLVMAIVRTKQSCRSALKGDLRSSQQQLRFSTIVPCRGSEDVRHCCDSCAIDT